MAGVILEAALCTAVESTTTSIRFDLEDGVFFLHVTMMYKGVHLQYGVEGHQTRKAEQQEPQAVADVLLHLGCNGSGRC